MKTVEMFCSHCESRIFETDRTCPQCGAPNNVHIDTSLTNKEKTEKEKLQDKISAYENIKIEKIKCALDLSEVNNILKYLYNELENI